MHTKQTLVFQDPVVGTLTWSPAEIFTSIIFPSEEALKGLSPQAKQAALFAAEHFRQRAQEVIACQAMLVQQIIMLSVTFKEKGFIDKTFDEIQESTMARMDEINRSFGG